MELTRNNLHLPFDCNMLSFFFFGWLALIISDHDDQILLRESGPRGFMAQKNVTLINGSSSTLKGSNENTWFTVEVSELHFVTLPVGHFYHKFHWKTVGIILLTGEILLYYHHNTETVIFNPEINNFLSFGLSCLFGLLSGNHKCWLLLPPQCLWGWDSVSSG